MFIIIVLSSIEDNANKNRSEYKSKSISFWWMIEKFRQMPFVKNAVQCKLSMGGIKMTQAL